MHIKSRYVWSLQLNCGRTTNLREGQTDNSLDFSLSLEIAPYFGISRDAALQIIDKVKGTVSQWKKTASQFGIPRAEMDMMEPSFRF